MTNYLLDVQPGLVQVLAQSAGGNTTHFLTGPRGILSYENPAGEWDAVAQNGLGSVRVEVDNNLNVVASHNLTPMGVEWGVQGAFGLPHEFTGEIVDTNVYPKKLHLREKTRTDREPRTPKKLHLGPGLA